MVEITLLELDIDGETFTANAPFGGKKGRGSESDAESAGSEMGTDASEDGGSGSRLPAALVGLVFLVVVGVVLRRYLSEDDEGMEREPEAPEVAIE